MTIVPDRPVTLNTTPEMFASWLESLTWNASSERIYKGDRTIALDRARTMYGQTRDGSIDIDMQGNYLYERIDPERGIVIGVEPFPRIMVRFNARPISADRVQVWHMCSEPAVEPYVRDIWRCMGETWPEALPSVPAMPDDPKPQAPETNQAPSKFANIGLSQRDMRMLELWHDGATAEYIGRETWLARATVYKEICKHRAILGREMVPLHQDRLRAKNR